MQQPPSAVAQATEERLPERGRVGFAFFGVNPVSELLSTIREAEAAGVRQC
jgi:hypothetical protein